MKVLVKRLIVTLVGLALVVLGSLWLYGFIGVKAGWIGPTEVPGLNAVSHSGAEAAGGIAAATKAKNFKRSTWTPEKRAAVSPEPTAFTSLPMRVKRKRNQATSSTATVIVIFSQFWSSALISALAGTAVSVVK